MAALFNNTPYLSQGKKGTREYLKDRFDFLFTCMVVDGRKGGDRDSASRWSLDGHQGNLPRFATVRDFLAVSLGDGLEKCATLSAF